MLYLDSAAGPDYWDSFNVSCYIFSHQTLVSTHSGLQEKHSLVAPAQSDPPHIIKVLVTPFQAEFTLTETMNVLGPNELRRITYSKNWFRVRGKVGNIAATANNFKIIKERAVWLLMKINF